MEARFSIFRGARKPRPIGTATLDELVGGIRASEKLRDGVALYRRTWDDDDKLKLPAFIPGGVFRYRSNTALVRHSGHCVIDLDHLDDAYAVRAAVSELAYCVCAFVSPSEEGVKMLVRVLPVPVNALDHQYAWERVCQSVRRDLPGVVIDDGHDVSRLCFMSFDPDVFVNDWPSPVYWEAPPKRPPKAFVASADASDVRRALACIPASGGTEDDYLRWVRVGAALWSAYKEGGFALFDEWSRGDAAYDERAVRTQYERYASRTPKVRIGTLFWLAKSYGWTK